MTARSGPTEITDEDLPFGADFFRRLFDSLYDGVYFVDRNRRLLYWNAGAERIAGYSREEVVGTYCNVNLLDHVDASGNHLCQSGCPLVAAVEEGQSTTERVFLLHKDGRRVAVDISVMPVRGDDGQVVGGVEIFRDASPVIALEEAYKRFRVLAEKDPLTGLANRRHLDMMLEQHVEVLARTGISFSVVLADIDRFKQVNDQYGHAVGDKILVDFADKLRSGARPTDVIGRFGGEEFLVLLPEQDLPTAAQVAERFRSTIASTPPAQLGKRGLTASFGVAQAVRGDDTLAVVRRADEALYRAKAQGRNRVEMAAGH